MSDKNEPPVYREEIVTFKQILVGKFSFFGTIAFFLTQVPGDKYLQFFGYTLIPLSIIAILFRNNLIRDDIRIYLLYSITGYGTAMWILAMTQAFNK